MKHQLAESEATLDTVPNFVVSRLKKSNWFGIVFLWLLALFCLIGPTAIPDKPGGTELETVALLGAFGLASLAGAIGGTRWMQIGAIIADDEKLLWRKAGKAHLVRWEDVSDYHLLSSSSPTSYKVETPSGRLTFGSDCWTNTPELAAFVQAHAHNAKVKEWQKKGARLVDPWPRSFSYQTFENRWFFPGMGVLCFSGPFLWLGTAHLSKIQEGIQSIGALYGWPGVVVYGLLTSSFVVMPLVGCALMLKMWRQTRQLQNERIEATPDGILWTNGERTIDATWDEVRAFYSRPSHTGHLAVPFYVVETEAGKFSFTRELSRFDKLKATIQTQATHAKINVEIGSGVSGQAIVASDGSRIYPYLTRLILSGAIGFSLLPTLMPMLMNFVNAPMDDFKPIAMPWPVSLLMLGAIGVAWKRFRLTGIRADERGLTQTLLRGEQFLAWEHIEEYFGTSEKSVVKGRDANGQKITLGFSCFIAGYVALREEIERRATHSRNRGWADKTLPQSGQAPSVPRLGQRECFGDETAPKVL